MYKELDSKKIGQAISKLRTHRDIKAVEVANHLSISESAYTRYERGETPVNIPFLNSVAQFFDVNPIHFIQNGPENVVENIHNSTIALQTNSSFSSINEDFMGQVIKLQEKLLDVVNKLADRI